jgi:hypothetical protein
MALLLILSLCRMSVAETWITLHKESIRLKEFTSCARVAKDGEQDLCDCCLVKNVDVLGYNAAEAAGRCTVNHRCFFAEETYYDLAAARQSVALSRQRLKSMTIANVDTLRNPPELPLDGALNGEDIIDIMHALNSEGWLNLPSQLFEKDSDGNRSIFATPLSDKDKGFYSGQLFFVGYKIFAVDNNDDEEQKTIPLYIVKETNKGTSEISHLYKVSASRLQGERVDTYDKHFGTFVEPSSTIAHIAFDDLHFKLKTSGATRYFSLLQTAAGQSLNKYLRTFGAVAQSLDTTDEQFEQEFIKIKHIFYRIGFAMSELHQKYADITDDRKGPLKRTFVHGDLHSQNIFYDEMTDKVTLIDNETFSLSLKRPSLGIDDIVEFYLLHTVKTVAHSVSFQLTNNREFGISDAIWHDMWRALFDGYLSAYGDLSEQEFEDLYDDFKDEFYEGFSQLHIFCSLHNLLDQRKLKRLGPSVRRSRIGREDLAATFLRLHAKKDQTIQRLR